MVVFFFFFGFVFFSRTDGTVVCLRTYYPSTSSSKKFSSLSDFSMSFWSLGGSFSLLGSLLGSNSAAAFFRSLVAFSGGEGFGGSFLVVGVPVGLSELPPKGHMLCCR